LFDTICDLAVKFAPELASSAHTLKTILPSSSVDLEALFSAILDNKDATLQDLAGRLNVPERDLVFLGYAGIAPSIQVCAEQLVPCLTIMPELRKGYCPICGNHPDLAFLDTDGKRHLKCCFCAHEWETKRMGCIFCENNDPELQHYFFTDEEKEYRVNLCDHCHQYIKVVDLRQMDRAFYPRLEQIATLHLDMKAREKGYTDPGALTNEESIE
jgi:FdhE protein